MRSILWLGCGLLLLSACTEAPAKRGAPPVPTRDPVPNAAAAGPLLWLQLRDVQGLFGGRNVFLKGDGQAWAQVVERGMQETRLAWRLSAIEMRTLEGLLRRHSFFRLVVKDRPGVPDEARPTLSARRTSGQEHHVSKWANDAHPDFDALLAWILARVPKTPQEEPLYQGPYAADWRPTGF